MNNSNSHQDPADDHHEPEDPTTMYLDPEQDEEITTYDESLPGSLESVGSEPDRVSPDEVAETPASPEVSATEKQPLSQTATADAGPPAPLFDINTENLPAQIGKYRITGLLGRSMALVFLAEQDNPTRKVVLKIPRGGQLMDGAVRARFKREADVAARLSHSGIVPILDMGEVDHGVPFFTMPYIEGDTLNTALAEGTFEWEDLLRLFKVLCKTIAALHEENLVHRDLKPANILVDKYGDIRLLDFGLAKALNDDDAPALTQVSAMMGTPHFMAPEQTGNGQEITPATDVYALGVILHIMLTGEKPYQLEGFDQRAIEVIRDMVPRPASECGPNLPSTLDALISQCLEKDPARRPASAGILLNQLNDVLTAAPDLQGFKLGGSREGTARASEEGGQAPGKAKSHKRQAPSGNNTGEVPESGRKGLFIGLVIGLLLVAGLWAAYTQGWLGGLSGGKPPDPGVPDQVEPKPPSPTPPPAPLTIPAGPQLQQQVLPPTSGELPSDAEPPVEKPAPIPDEPKRPLTEKLLQLGPE